MFSLKKYCKVNIKPKHKNKILTIGYAVAILFAFVLSLSNNNNVNASVSYNDRIDYLMLESNISNNLQDTGSIYPEESVKNIKSLFDMVTSYRREEAFKRPLIVESGDTFISMLTNMGLEYAEADEIYRAYKKVYNPANIRVGQKFMVEGVFDNQLNKVISISKISLDAGAGKRYVLTQLPNKQYAATEEKDEILTEVSSATGTISGSLSASMQKQGVSSRVTNEFIRIFSFSVDFRRDIRKGDKFEIIYENNLTPDGKIVSSGNILYAAITLRNDKIALYQFKDAKGNVDYYNEKGIALKKMLHRKPMAYQNARISSPFGRRRHPILKAWKIHWGVDYAAPKGSAIFAGGDGVVQVAKYNGGYGNYIKIKHNSEYATAYGHMNSFAKGIRPGVRVKQGQVIGYVGSTGRSTGPHLHYEVIRNGKRVNPTTIKAATGNNLAGKDLHRFKKQVADIKINYSKMFADASKSTVASK